MLTDCKRYLVTKKRLELIQNASVNKYEATNILERWMISTFNAGLDPWGCWT